MMLKCWDSEPQSRPTFSDIVTSLSQSLEAMADYLDISAFSNELEHNLDADQPSEAEAVIKEDAQQESGEPQASVEECDNKETTL